MQQACLVLMSPSIAPADSSGGRAARRFVANLALTPNCHDAPAGKPLECVDAESRLPNADPAERTTVHRLTSRFRRAAWTGLALTALLAASACGGSSTTAPTATAPITPPTTEVFTGTVSVGGSDSHTFTVVLSNGQLNVILTAAGPPSTITVGLGIGAPSGSTCAFFAGGAGPTQAGTIAQLSGVAQAGTYCVAVYDAGNQLADVTYSLTVTHY